MIVEIKSKTTKKLLINVTIWALDWSTMNDLELLILFKVAFMVTMMNIKHWIWKINNFDKNFYDKLKIEIKIFEINKKDPDAEIVIMKKILEKIMLKKFDEWYILDIKKF